MIASVDHEPLRPERVLRETARAWERANRETGEGAAIEVYSRRSRRVRVRVDRPADRVEERGWDAGVAVRAKDLSTSGVGFASSTGPAERVAAPLARIARESAVHGIPESLPWSRRNEEVLCDLESSLDLPSTGRLSEWLDEALHGRNAQQAAALWIEAAMTVEAVAAEGLSWIRSRRRIWAVAFDEAVPRSSAARRLEDLPPIPPAAARPTHVPGPLRGPLRLGPGPLSVLVPALVRALHGVSPPIGLEVGRGWIVRDDPLHRAAVVGGGFDDSGFEAVPRDLALGGRIVRGLDGPGTLRRGSYRDLPEPGPSLLVVTPPEGPIPDDGLDVLALRIESASPKSWLLEMDGERRKAGKPAGAFRGARLWSDPVTLARACVSGAGQAQGCGWGVFSPPLVFEGLRVEG